MATDVDFSQVSPEDLQYMAGVPSSPTIEGQGTGRLGTINVTQIPQDQVAAIAYGNTDPALHAKLQEQQQRPIDTGVKNITDDIYDDLTKAGPTTTLAANAALQEIVQWGRGAAILADQGLQKTGSPLSSVFNKAASGLDTLSQGQDNFANKLQQAYGVGDTATKASKFLGKMAPYALPITAGSTIGGAVGAGALAGGLSGLPDVSYDNTLGQNVGNVATQAGVGAATAGAISGLMQKVGIPIAKYLKDTISPSTQAQMSTSLDSLIKQVNPSAIGDPTVVQKSSQQILNDLHSAHADVISNLYNKAGNTPIPPEAAAGINSKLFDPASPISGVMKQIKNDLLDTTSPYVENKAFQQAWGADNTTLAPYDVLKQRMFNTAQSLRNDPSTARPMTASALDAARTEMVSTLDRYSPEYAQARMLAGNKINAIDAMKGSLVGKLADANAQQETALTNNLFKLNSDNFKQIFDMYPDDVKPLIVQQYLQSSLGKVATPNISPYAFMQKAMNNGTISANVLHGLQSSGNDLGAAKFGTLQQLYSQLNDQSALVNISKRLPLVKELPMPAQQDFNRKAMNFLANPGNNADFAKIMARSNPNIANQADNVIDLINTGSAGIGAGAGHVYPFAYSYYNKPSAPPGAIPYKPPSAPSVGDDEEDDK